MHKLPVVMQLFADPPDHFLDPVTCTLMADPVRLPTSNTNMDRATILRHLLSDPRDPISRAPLAPEQLEEAPALCAEIASWKAEQRRLARGKVASGMTN